MVWSCTDGHDNYLLNGELEEVYMKQPEGSFAKGHAGDTSVQDEVKHLWCETIAMMLEFSTG